MLYNISKHVKNYKKTAFNIFKVKYIPLLKIFVILIKISVHSKIISMHTLGNTAVNDHLKIHVLSKKFFNYWN